MQMQRFLSNKMDIIERWLWRQDWTDAVFDQVVAKVNQLADLADRKFGHLKAFDKTPLALSVDGSADAAGHDTVARAELSANITDHGSVAVGSGRSRFFAAAEEGTAYATSSASSDVSGADFVLRTSKTVTGDNWSLTEHRVIALDFDFLDLPKPRIHEIEKEIDLSQKASVGDGNIATADFDADVRAEDSYLDVYADAIAVEDAYSGSSITATLAIG